MKDQRKPINDTLIRLKKQTRAAVKNMTDIFVSAYKRYPKFGLKSKAPK